MLMGALIPAGTQAQALSLDSCRAMALRNNKQLNASKLKKDVAYNLKKSARTKYLPKVDALGGYEWFSREISLSQFLIHQSAYLLCQFRGNHSLTDKLAHQIAGSSRYSSGNSRTDI